MPSAKANGRKNSVDDDQKKQPHPAQLISGQNAQKTISELFATSKQGVKNREIDDLPTSLPSKRLKHNHIVQEQQNIQCQVGIIRARDMYNFSANHRRAPSEIIDLTSSPNGSPMKKKAPNGLVKPSHFTSSTGPKKLVVKNLKRTTGTDPEQYYNDVWARLDAALTAIFHDEKVLHSKETLYNEVMILCRQNKAPTLYEMLCRKCTKEVIVRVKAPLVEIAGRDPDVEVLRTLINVWTSWSERLETIRSIFFFLDRSYLLRSGLPSIREMGTHEFQEHVFANNAVQLKVLQGACDLVKAERSARATSDNDGLLRDAIKMFHVLPVYSLYFEPKLLAESQEFYSLWAEQTVASTDLADYLKMCDKFFGEELLRCEAWGLDATTKQQLEMYLEEILIEHRETRLLNVEDIGQILDRDRTDSLRQLYLLLERKNLGEKLRPAFEAYIVKRGSEIVFDEAREQDMVIRLLDFKKKLDRTWEHSFQKHTGLGHTLREAFEAFINKSKRSNMTWGTDNPKPGEMIAKYVDMVLKGGAKAIRTWSITVEDATKLPEQDGEASSEDEDTEITKQLDQVLDLFRFVHGKAVFEAFYKRDLARRLLLGRSASSDAEKSMLTKLKSGKRSLLAVM